jgi:NadR type nicotinamide-nucleotide adenylyltransferase
MSRFGHGLVIGKFRPPHKGHSLLIRTALERSERVTVVVCSDAADSIPAELRAAWLREIHPEAEVRVVETTGTDPHDSRFWAEQTILWFGKAPDAVFTSEAYGETYAHFLGCSHVSVDPERRLVPISASLILARPLAHLEYLEPGVRAHFIPRVALVGAESTGKTTLARALAAHYGTTWVPEYGRPYWDGLLTLPRLDCTTADFVHIAEAQQRMEDALARHAQRVLICDTDALTTELWHERYLQHDAPAVRALADARQYALYLLTADEIPWQDDGTRDSPHLRPWFQSRFRQELEARQKPFIYLDGPPDRRLATAVAAIDRLLAEAGDPLATRPTTLEVSP